MRILYLHQYFKTPEEGGAIRSYYLGKALAEQGHEVLMVTRWNGNTLRKERIAGMEVYYLPVPYNNHMGFWQRGNSFLQYLKQARRLLDNVVPADLVYATSTPLTIGLLALYLQRRHKIPYIFEVRDLWPEAPIQMGALRNIPLIHGLRRLERHIYRQALAVVALSPGMANGIRSSYPAANIELAPNMADCSFFTPTPKPLHLLQQWGLEGQFVVSYTGSAGPVNQLEHLLAAAEACQKAALPVRFLIAAAGARTEALEQKAQGLHNLLFLPYGSKERVRDYLAVSDAVYISFAAKPVLETSSPNKFFDGLAAGKLCIVSTRGWLQEMVEQQHCGFYANPNVPQAFVDKLQPYLQNRELLLQAQQQARHTAETQFSRKQISARVVALVERLAQR